MGVYKYKISYDAKTSEYASEAIEGDIQNVPQEILSEIGRLTNFITQISHKAGESVSLEVRIESDLIE
jgi:LPS O-antigen subunit length determinant protein (WzzB/FepE family)